MALKKLLRQKRRFIKRSLLVFLHLRVRLHLQLHKVHQFSSLDWMTLSSALPKQMMVYQFEIWERTTLPQTKRSWKRTKTTFKVNKLWILSKTECKLVETKLPTWVCWFTKMLIRITRLWIIHIGKVLKKSWVLRSNMIMCSRVEVWKTTLSLCYQLFKMGNSKT